MSAFQAADIAHKYGNGTTRSLRPDPKGRYRINCPNHPADGLNCLVWDNTQTGHVMFKCTTGDCPSAQIADNFKDDIQRGNRMNTAPQPPTKRNAPATTEAIIKNFAASVKRNTAAPAGEFKDNRTADGERGPWVYPPNADGEILQIRRVNHADGGKYFVQYHKEGGRFVKGGIKGLAVPYLSDNIPADSTLPILFHEGEKAAHAGESLYGDRSHSISAPGGAGNAHVCDLSVCHGKVVIIAHDNDEVGRRHARQVYGILKDKSQLFIIPLTEAYPPKWDIADPLPDGITAEDHFNSAWTAADVIEEWDATAPVEDVPNDSAQTREKFTPTSTVETCGINFPPRQWVIDGFMPPGTTLLFGLPKVGKTLFITKMLACLATGSAFLGYPVTKQDVLYIDGEDDQQGFQERLKLIGFSLGVPGMHEFCPADEWQFDEAGRLEIEGWLGQNPTVKTIVLDTLENLLPYPSAMQQGLHAQQRDVQRLKPVRRWADRLGVSVIVIHHPKKGQADGDFFSLCAGSNGIRGTVQTIMGIEPDKDSEELYMLRAQSRRMPALEVRLERKKGSVQWERAETVETVKLTDLQNEIKSYLEKFPHSKPGLIAEVTGRKSTTIRVTCLRMAREGLLGRSGKGEYFIPGLETPANIADAVQDKLLEPLPEPAPPAVSSFILESMAELKAMAEEAEDEWPDGTCEICEKVIKSGESVDTSGNCAWICSEKCLQKSPYCQKCCVCGGKDGKHFGQWYSVDCYGNSVCSVQCHDKGKADDPGF